MNQKGNSRTVYVSFFNHLSPGDCVCYPINSHHISGEEGMCMYSVHSVINHGAMRCTVT